MSARNLDASGRLRSVTVGFRKSPEEARRLDLLVSLSGLTKQDYITARLMNEDVTVVPSSRSHASLRALMEDIVSELERIGRADGVDDWLRERIEIAEERYPQVRRRRDAERESASRAIHEMLRC